MNQIEFAAVPATGLSQAQRLASVFVAPSMTFEDIRAGHRSWWLPYLLLAAMSYILFGAVVQHVGIPQTIENQIRMNPRAQEQMGQANPEQVQRMQNFWTGLTEGMFIASPLVALLYVVIIAGVLLGTINFVFGGRAQFGAVVAMVWYAWLPTAIQVLMGVAVMWFQPPEMFNVKNLAPTNPATLFLDPSSASSALYVFCAQMDVVTIWSLVLLSIGLATVAGVKRSHGFIAVFGWWILMVLFKVGMAAAFS